MGTRDSVALFTAVIANGAAVALMMRLLVIYRQYYGRKRTEGRYYLYFIRSVIGMAVIDLARWLLSPYRENFTFDGLKGMAPSETALLVVCSTLDFLNLFMSTLFFFLWLLYVGYRLYPTKDYVKRRFLRAVSPLFLSGAAVVVCIIATLFAPDRGYVTVWALFVFLAIRMFYFIHSVLRINLYKKQNGYMKFFNIRGFFLPVIAGMLIQDFSSFHVCALGAAIGATLLYASIVREKYYQDAETGLYNLHYREYLTKLIRLGRYAPCSALVFKTGEGVDITGLAGMIKQQLPKDSEPIRHGDNEVVVLTQVKEKAPLTMVAEDVKAMTEAEVETSCILKKKDETPEAFMERIL